VGGDSTNPKSNSEKKRIYGLWELVGKRRALFQEKGTLGIGVAVLLGTRVGQKGNKVVAVLREEPSRKRLGGKGADNRIGNFF